MQFCGETLFAQLAGPTRCPVHHSILCLVEISFDLSNPFWQVVRDGHVTLSSNELMRKFAAISKARKLLTKEHRQWTASTKLIEF